VFAVMKASHASLPSFAAAAGGGLWLKQCKRRALISQLQKKSGEAAETAQQQKRVSACFAGPGPFAISACD
jgi:hypothetical protein